MTHDQMRILLVAESPSETWIFGRVLNQSGITTEANDQIVTSVENLSDVDFNIDYDCVFVVPGERSCDIARLRRMCSFYRVVVVIDEHEEADSSLYSSEMVEGPIEVISIDKLADYLTKEFVLHGETVNV